MPSIPLLQPLRREVEEVERLLQTMLADAEEPLRTMLREAACGGKRLRASLIIVTAQLLKRPLPPFCRLAAAVEMLHCATLIHDDVVDRSPVRRGRETLHRTWPTGATVLAGDYLLALAVSTIAELENPRIVHILAQALRMICAGEVHQSLALGRQRGSRDDYYLSIEAKTAALFAASMEMAAVLAEADDSQIAALRSFGRELGLAFQIADDVLDVTGSEAQLGKPVASDLRQGLATFPIILYLERAADTDPVRTVLAGQGDETQIQAAIHNIRCSGAIEAALVGHP